MCSGGGGFAEVEGEGASVCGVGDEKSSASEVPGSGMCDCEGESCGGGGIEGVASFF